MDVKSKKKKKIEFWAQIAVFLVVTLTILLFTLMKDNTTPDTVRPSGIAEGLAIPDFTFPGIDGVSVSLSDFKGKVVLVNIWATWCKPCVDEMPSMEKLYQKFKDKNFMILAVSIDESGRDAVASFMRKLNLTFPALIDSKGTIKSLYGVTGVPESFIIDQNGILVKKIIGQANWAAPEAVSFFQELVHR
jgi:peroxiredoxin